MLDTLAILVNSVGWGIKPVLEKISVDKIGHNNFSYIRYVITGIIALPLLIYNIQTNGIGKKFEKNPNYLKDSLIWGTIVALVSLAASQRNVSKNKIKKLMLIDVSKAYFHAPVKRDVYIVLPDEALEPHERGGERYRRRADPAEDG